jgi:hypothetical protein
MDGSEENFAAIHLSLRSALTVSGQLVRAPTFMRSTLVWLAGMRLLMLFHLILLI